MIQLIPNNAKPYVGHYSSETNYTTGFDASFNNMMRSLSLSQATTTIERNGKIDSRIESRSDESAFPRAQKGAPYIFHDLSMLNDTNAIRGSIREIKVIRGRAPPALRNSTYLFLSVIEKLRCNYHYLVRSRVELIAAVE